MLNYINLECVRCASEGEVFHH